MKRLNALFLTLVTLLQSVVSLEPTLSLARALSLGAGTIATTLVLARQAYAQTNSAQAGQSAGSSFLGLAAGGLTGTDASGYVQNVGGYNAAQMTAATGSASVNTPTLNNPGIQQFSCQQQAYLGLLGSNCAGVAVPVTSCVDPNYSSALAALQANAQQAITQAQTVCAPVLRALDLSAGAVTNQLGTVAQSTPALLQIPGLTSQISGQIQQANSQLQTVLTAYAQGLPYCDAIVSGDAYTYASQSVNDANALASACTNLPSSVTQASASSVATQLQTIATAYGADASASGVQAVTSEMRYAAALMTTTNNGALNLAGLMGPYASGGSNTLGTNTGNPLVNILNDPANASLVSVLNQVLHSTDPMSLVPAGSGLFDVCSTTSTKTPTAGTQGTATISPVTSPQLTSVGSVNVCMDTGRGLAIPGAPSAQWVYIPATPGVCNGQKLAGSFLIATSIPYQATGSSASSLNLNFSAISDGPATVSIATDNGVSQTNTVPAGDNLMQGASGSTSPPNVVIPLPPAGSSVVSATVSVTLSQPGDFALSLGSGTYTLLATSDAWYTPPTGQTTTQVPVAPGSTVNIPAPSAVQNQVSCKAAFQCLGTQCHSIMGTQDQSFSSATAGLAVLQSIAQNASCAPGTSEAAGDCALDIFKGKASYCRNFAGSGLGLTSNCCAQPINVSPLSTLIKVAGIAYAEGWVPSYGGSVLSNLPSWAQSSYASTAAWVNTTTGEITSTAGQVWSTVSAPFKSMSASLANAFGAGGTSAMSQVLGTAFNVTGTGTTAPTPSSTGATYATSGAAGGTSSVGMTGGSGSGAGTINLVGSFAKMIGGGMQGIADQVIENLMGQAAAPVESALFGAASPSAAQAAGSTYSGPVATGASPANGSMLGSGIVGDIMLAYAIYEIACLIGHLITQCDNEEMTFYQDRRHRLCFNVGSYCASSGLGICLETKYVACCYASMLDRIIMQQLLAMDPGIVNGSTAAQPYGDPQSSPACDGLTPQNLAAVTAGGYFGRLDFSEYIAYLEQSNMLPATNETASQWLTPGVSHTTGVVNEAGAPTTNTAIYSGQ